ncbi:MAG: glycoside hydrolase family 127 protein [Clostridiales bacterium]|nr:glycoside hydrolase family 127 protein [Clostridiales bacterium]
MPTYQQYCRPPLVDPAYAALPDGAVHVEGGLRGLTDRVLGLTNPDTVLPLDAVLASKLGEYTDLPPIPAVKDMAAALPGSLAEFVPAMRAAVMTAVAEKDKDALLSCLQAMKTFEETLPEIDEYALMPVAADSMRCAQELYRRTGKAFLLDVMASIRAQVPDVSGLFHSFPFLKAFTPEPVPDDAVDDTSKYFRRMKMLGTGKTIADALALTALFAMYSGSARDAGASGAGLNSLERFHGMPNGMYTAEPYLAGREPSASTDLPSVCAMLEALHDLLSAGGEFAVVERMEIIVENAFANLFAKDKVYLKQAVDREANEPTYEAEPPSRADVGALLRGIAAVRRSVWMVKGEGELAMLLPYDSVCLTRMNGVPVRVAAGTEADGNISFKVEAKQPVLFTLSLRVPSYADSARITVSGEKPQIVECGMMHQIKRTFRTGDRITLDLNCKPYMKAGHRGSVSVYYRAMLMALPLPEADAAWQYALDEKAKPAVTLDGGKPSVRIDACVAPSWTVKNGRIPSPPQGLHMGDAYELTLLPYQDTVGRVAVFPQAVNG